MLTLGRSRGCKLGGRSGEPHSSPSCNITKVKQKKIIKKEVSCFATNNTLLIQQTGSINLFAISISLSAAIIN